MTHYTQKMDITKKHTLYIFITSNCTNTQIYIYIYIYMYIYVYYIYIYNKERFKLQDSKCNRLTLVSKG